MASSDKKLCGPRGTRTTRIMDLMTDPTQNLTENQIAEICSENLSYVKCVRWRLNNPAKWAESQKKQHDVASVKKKKVIRQKYLKELALLRESDKKREIQVQIELPIVADPIVDKIKQIEQIEQVVLLKQEYKETARGLSGRNYEYVPRALRAEEPLMNRLEKEMASVADRGDNRKVVDMVSPPAQYIVGGIEVADFIKAKNLSYGRGNVVKYVTRAGVRDKELEDLEKAAWYLASEIATLKGIK